MDRFVSEQIQPVGESIDASAMARGEPGLPACFQWRDETYEVVSVVRQWKAAAAEGGRPGGEVYLRRHYYEIQMSDGSVWTVYLVRQTPKSGSPKARWFLYTITS